MTSRGHYRESEVAEIMNVDGSTVRGWRRRYKFLQCIPFKHWGGRGYPQHLWRRQDINMIHNFFNLQKQHRCPITAKRLP